MNRPARMLFSVIATVATFFFIMLFYLICFDQPSLARLLVALIISFVVARHSWLGGASAPIGLIRSVGLGALVTGAICFAAGFFGPMILAPGANQGPLLGILITGPLGALVGAVGGAIRWWWRRGKVAL